jgi:hypothetical protein
MEVSRLQKPANVFYIAIDEDSVMHLNVTRASQRPIDVLYTSSHCEPARETLVRVIRQELEQAGLRFEYNGRCTAGSSKARYRHAAGDEPALEAKMMMAVSRSQDPTTEALDEKLSKAMKFGCIPVYSGMGQRLAKSVQGFPDAYLDRQKYTTDRAFALAVVHILANSTLLDAMQQQLVAHKWQNTSTCGAVRTFLRFHPPTWTYQHAGPRGVMIAKNDGTGISNDFFMKTIRCIFETDATRNNYTWVHKLQHADIEVNHCCFG